MSEVQVDRRPSTWRIILAFVLDLVTSFALLGLAVASLTGGLTPNGFQLNGAPALLLFALIIAYFVLCNRLLGGTLWKYILRAR